MGAQPDRFWARLHEIGTFPSGACHSGRKQLQSVFVGPFLENNGPVWHSRRPVGPFWLTFGGVWAFLETRPAGTPHLQTQNGPPLATKALKLANHQPIWPPAHSKTPWAFQRPLQGTWFGPQIWLVGHFAHSTAVSPLVSHLAAPAHLAQAQRWQNQSKRCATTLWGASLAVVWGFGPQHANMAGVGGTEKLRKSH